MFVERWFRTAPSSAIGLGSCWGAIVVSSTVSLGALLIAKAIGYSLPTVLTATMGGVAARVYAAGLKRSR